MGYVEPLSSARTTEPTFSAPCESVSLIRRTARSGFACAPVSRTSLISLYRLLLWLGICRNGGASFDVRIAIAYHIVTQ